MTTPASWPPPPPPPPFPPLFRPPLPRAPRATLALVLGIVGVAGGMMLLLPLLAAPLAWYHGAVARRMVEREPTRWSGSGEATTGMVLGMIGTGLLMLLLGALLLVAGGLLLISRYDAGYGT